MSLIDLYVRDKSTGKIHKVGSDIHDGLWVDSNGTVHYQKEMAAMLTATMINLQDMSLCRAILENWRPTNDAGRSDFIISIHRIFTCPRFFRCP